jgi:hypothetical protein
MIREGIIPRQRSTKLISDLLTHGKEVNKSLQYLVTLSNLIVSHREFDNKTKENIILLIKDSHENFMTNCAENDYLDFIKSCIQKKIVLPDDEYVQVIIANTLDIEPDDISTLESLASLIMALPSKIEANYAESIKSLLLKYWTENPEEYISESDVFSDYVSPDETSDMVDQVFDYFKDYLNDYLSEHVDFHEIQQVFSNIDVEQHAIDYINDLDQYDDNSHSGTNDNVSTDDVIHDLFDRSNQ